MAFFDWKEDRTSDVQAIIETLENQFDTLTVQFNRAMSGNAPTVELAQLVNGCAVLGKTLFEIKTSPAYEAHMEAFSTIETPGEAATPQPSGMA